MQQSETIDALAAALALAQGEMKHATNDSDNPFFKSKYADLASVTNACRPALVKHGLSVIHGTDSADGMSVTVTVRLLHKSGQWLQSSLTLKPTKADPQGIGSAITYARRYTLAAIVGVATEDDDGNAASAPTPQGASRNREVPRVPPSNPTGPKTEDITRAVTEWLGIQKEDVPGVVKQIKANLGLGTAPLSVESIPAVLAKIAKLKAAGVTLDTINANLSK